MRDLSKVSVKDLTYEEQYQIVLTAFHLYLITIAGMEEVEAHAEIGLFCASVQLTLGKENPWTSHSSAKTTPKPTVGSPN